MSRMYSTHLRTVAMRPCESEIVARGLVSLCEQKAWTHSHILRKCFGLFHHSSQSFAAPKMCSLTYFASLAKLCCQLLSQDVLSPSCSLDVRHVSEYPPQGFAWLEQGMLRLDSWEQLAAWTRFQKLTESACPLELWQSQSLNNQWHSGLTVLRVGYIHAHAEEIPLTFADVIVKGDHIEEFEQLWWDLEVNVNFNEICLTENLCHPWVHQPCIVEIRMKGDATPHNLFSDL